jgi:thiol-disulfide isomerase/thioredoxin
LPLAVGDPAPPFSGEDVLTGQPFSLADHEGKVLVVAFSGLTYCEPCQLEAPVLQELSEEYPFSVQFVMVELEWPAAEKYPQVPPMLEKLGITFPVIFDVYPEEGPLYPIMEVYGDGVLYVPTLVVIKQDMTVCAIKTGATGPADALKAEIAEILEGCGASDPILSLAPQEWVAVVQILFGVVQDGGGLTIPGGPIPPWSPLRQSAQTRSALVALAIHQLAKGIADRRQSIELQDAANPCCSLILGNACRARKARAHRRRSFTAASAIDNGGFPPPRDLG